MAGGSGGSLRIDSSLGRAFRRYPAGLGTLAAALSEEEDAIEEIYEPYLMQIGMIGRTPRGRVPTQRAYEYFGRTRRQPLLVPSPRKRKPKGA